MRHLLKSELVPACQARVLLVDDEVVNRHMIQQMLQRLGMTIDCAEHGIAALARLRSQIYTLVLMDIEMPRLNGEDTTRRLRSELKLEQLPVVAITSHDSDADRVRCLQAGMDDYLIKPLDTQDLCRVLRRWLDLSAATTAQEVAKSPLPDFPGVDSARALVRLDQNVALYHDMLQMFYQRNQTTAAQLTNLLATKQWRQARLLAHGLKGTSGHLGMHDLEASAKAVEQGIAKHPDEPLSELAVANLIAELARILRGLAILKTPPVVPAPNLTESAPIEPHTKYRIFSPSQPEPTQLIPQLQQLHRLLDEDMRAARTLMQQTAESTAHSTVVLSIQSIVDAIEDFDIDRAQHEIQCLVASLD